MDNFVNDLKIADSLPIDGMDLYQLNVFEQSALKKAIDNGKIPPAATTKKQAKGAMLHIGCVDCCKIKNLIQWLAIK